MASIEKATEAEVIVPQDGGIIAEGKDKQLPPTGGDKDALSMTKDPPSKGVASDMPKATKVMEKKELTVSIPNKVSKVDVKTTPPGSARKTGRPVGKQYVEHLLAQIEKQGHEITDQVKKSVLGDDESFTSVSAASANAQPGKSAVDGVVTGKDGVEALNQAVTPPLSNDDERVPLLLLVSPPTTTPEPGPPKLYLAAVTSHPIDGTTNDISATPHGHLRPDESIGGVVIDTSEGAPAPMQNGNNGEQKDHPAPIVHPSLSAIQMSESESATSQSENEGGEDMQGKKRRKGHRKRKKILNDAEDQFDKESQPPKLTQMSTEGSEVQKEGSVEEESVEKDLILSQQNDGTKIQPSADSQVSDKGHGEEQPKEMDGNKTDKEGEMPSGKEKGSKEVAKPPEVEDIDGEKAEVSDLGHSPQKMKKRKHGKDEIPRDESIKQVKKAVTANVATEAVKPVKQSAAQSKLLKSSRPKRKIKHKFLESSEESDDSPSRSVSRGRGRSRSAFRGRAVRRRGRGRGSKGGLRGRGGGRGRGRGSGRGRGGFRGRGRRRGGRTILRGGRGRGRGRASAHSGLVLKSKQSIPLLPAGGTPEKDANSSTPHASTEETVKNPVPEDEVHTKVKIGKVVKRGGFRGGRRRNSAGRGGYRNVASRGRGRGRGGLKKMGEKSPDVLKKVLGDNSLQDDGLMKTLEHNTPIPVAIFSSIEAVESIDKLQSSSEELKSSSTESLSISLKEGTNSDSSPTKVPENAPNEILPGENEQEDMDNRYPIPFACLRGKARKSAKPRSNTHFGQRKRKMSHKNRRAYDSDSTDQQSEGSMGPPSSKRFHRSNSSSTYASADSEEDVDIRPTPSGRMAPPAAPTPSKVTSGDHNYSGLEPPLCCCKMAQDKPITAIANNCEALEIVNGKVALCETKVDENKVFRPSSRIPFRSLCPRHRKKMILHHCCPGCGCFCATGLAMMCTIDGYDHYFHKECIREIDHALYCPHCGEDAAFAKEIMLPEVPGFSSLNILPESVLLSHERIKLPKAILSTLTGLKGLDLKEALENHRDKSPVMMPPRAKMVGRSTSPGRASSPVMPETPPHQDENVFQLQLKNGRTINSGMLPQGPSRDSLEMAMKFMDPENPRRLRFAPKNLYMASSLGEIEKVLQMLGEGFDPNYHFPSHNRETPVHAAAAKGHLDIVCMLVQAGANIDAEDEDHRTPLHLAVEKEQLECSKFLIRHGARPEHQDDDGTAVVHIATMKGNQDILQYLLNHKKVKVNAQDNGGWTPIIWAADNKNITMVKFLLDRGADPIIRDKEQNIGLHWAAYSGCEEVLEELMNHCSFSVKLVNTVNIHGDTPLHIAARENNYGCVMQMLMRKANATIRNKEGEMPLDCAVHKSEVWTAIEANLRINVYVQKRNLRTERILSRDISRGRENVPIPVINCIDDDSLPDDFLYMADNCETSQLDINRSITPMQGCRCEDDCSTESCPCGQSSVRCWYNPEGHLAEDFNYQEPPLIFECGRACNCWRTCRNRVVQNGIKAHLQLFRTARMGWGVRTTQDIPKGSFICQYSGELISDAEADKREDDSYLFDLENREGDVYCIDARFYGNISRFVNHLCEPNIVPVRVFIEHWDLRFPHIAFFASRDIKAFEELGFDYGDKFWSIKSKYFTCNCGSKLCKHCEA